MNRKFMITMLALSLVASLGLNLYQNKILNQAPVPEEIQVVERVVERVVIVIARQKGLGTYYGEPEHGQTMANGEIFDMYAITCAHVDLPFGTELLVTNLKNGKSIRVIVTDRLPRIWHRKGRVIDLSYATAVELDMVRDGIVPVEIKILKEII